MSVSPISRDSAHTPSWSDSFEDKVRSTSGGGTNSINHVQLSALTDQLSEWAWGIVSLLLHQGIEVRTQVLADKLPQSQ